MQLMDSAHMIYFQSTQLKIAGSCYEFTSDNGKNTESVRVPSRKMYKINRILGIGFQRIEISGFNDERLLISDFSVDKKLLSISRPGENKTCTSYANGFLPLLFFVHHRTKCGLKCCVFSTFDLTIS